MPGDDLRRHCGDGRRPGAGAVSDTDIELRESPRGGLVATVCHDNAAKLNVIDGDGAEALVAAIRRACESRDVRVVVLRGVVERSIDSLAKGFASGEPRKRMRAFLDRKR